MSTFSPSKNRILLFTLMFSLVIHLLVLKFINANRNPAGNFISLGGDKTNKIAVRIKQKTIRGTEKQTGGKRESETKPQVKPTKKKKEKRRKPKIKKRIADKNKREKKKIQKKTQATEKEKQIKNADREVKQEKEKKQKVENAGEKRSNLSKEFKREENKKTTNGGSLFSFLNWKNMYIREVINSLDKNKNYPEMAKEMGIQGTVNLVLIIDKNGNVEKVEIAESSGFSILDKNAVETVKKSKFPPFPPEVKKERMKVSIYITYKIKGND